MEVMCFAPSQPPLLLPKFLNPIKSPNNDASNTTAKFKPFISASSISNPAAEISTKQALISREKPFHKSPSSSPPLLSRVPSDSLNYPAGYLGAVPEPIGPAGDGVHGAMWYLTNILSSKVYDVALESPLHFAPKLSQKLGINVWLKREDLQPPRLGPKFTNPIKSPNNDAFRTNTNAAKMKPLIVSTISKSTSEPAVASREKPLQNSPSKPPPLSLLRVSTNSLQYPAGFLGAVPDRFVSECPDGIPDEMGYLTNILASMVYDVAVESPLQFASKLSERLGVNMWLKREDLQPVFSFKLRGAYNMMAKLPKEQLERGVICSSAGNHAQGVALAAQRLGCSAVIAMPVTTPEIKWKSVERLGATVVLVGDSYDEAQTYAKKRGEEEGRTFIPPFDHPDVIMGQGTVGMEIVRQMRGPVHAIFVPVGGGGLIAGIAAYVKRVSPEVKIIGVEPADANAMALSLHHGQRVMLDQVGGFADGVAVKVVGEETFRLCRELIDGVVLVSRDAICASIKTSAENMIYEEVFKYHLANNISNVSRQPDDMFEEKRSILEPAGALALAGAEAYCKYYGLEGENIVAITSGANMNFDRLRLVTELADVGRQREAVLATLLPEEPGSFKQFCELVGPMNITEFKYRYNSDKEEALMGGRSNVRNELLCRFVFPERPGALMKFLDALSPRWNISLFHYRGQGETGANVLVGIQVAQSEMEEFRDRATGLGYDYMVENTNEAFQLLIH
ncbi:hypothetical protein TEA_025086 [Camellia sinensis var. sinensis]|uniref:threonine ammonia-lyase n=1 Tax=Camellia sinensis var. sinensis TaxID=542762 RepID=A0A4V3WN11_CAMSN|nr:hypothetical protein TEA_025086 [Camellia sinensis var. sinensis]